MHTEHNQSYIQTTPTLIITLRFVESNCWTKRNHVFGRDLRIIDTAYTRRPNLAPNPLTDIHWAYSPRFERFGCSPPVSSGQCLWGWFPAINPLWNQQLKSMRLSPWNMYTVEYTVCSEDIHKDDLRRCCCSGEWTFKIPMSSIHRIFGMKHWTET